MFDFYYKSAKPSGITFSIADTEKSNGNGGTDGLTPWHAEVQGRNGNMEIFMNSNDDVSLFEIMPEARPFLIENLTNIVATYAHLSLTVKPDYFGWNDNRHEDHNWDLNREGYISSKYLFAMDGRTYIPNYGTGKEDKALYLGMNQVVYPYDTANIGMGLCRACITIRRKCNDAELEVDLTTGQTWGFPTNNVDWYRPLKKSSLVAGGCSMQGVLKFTTSTIKRMKMRFFYGDVDIAGTHMILADSPNAEGFGNDWANKYRAQIHAWNKELTQYVALHENWPNGVQGGHRLYTGTRLRNFFEKGATYDITLEDRIFSYSNNAGHSGSKMNPWMFRMNNKKIKSEPLDEDVYLGLNRVPRDGKDGKNSGLCHVCIWID